MVRKPTEYQIIVTGIIAHFPFSDFDNLKTFEFKGKSFLIPQDIEGHLVRNYGPDWKTPEKDPKQNHSRTAINNYKKITYAYIISINEEDLK